MFFNFWILNRTDEALLFRSRNSSMEDISGLTKSIRPGHYQMFSFFGIHRSLKDQLKAEMKSYRRQKRMDTEAMTRFAGNVKLHDLIRGEEVLKISSKYLKRNRCLIAELVHGKLAVRPVN